MLPIIPSKRKSGAEQFTYNGNQQRAATLRHFWVWSTSDLVGNTARGVLAEFIVALSLGQKNKLRREWDPYDLEYQGLKIEVKSAAYVQSWNQRNYSRIAFGVRKTRGWDPESNRLSDVAKRQADIYVFALLAHKDQETIDPLNLNQWVFYVLSRRKIDEKCPEAKALSLKKLKTLNPQKCSYARLKRYILEEAAYGKVLRRRGSTFDGFQVSH